MVYLLRFICVFLLFVCQQVWALVPTTTMYYINGKNGLFSTPAAACASVGAQSGWTADGVVQLGSDSWGCRQKNAGGASYYATVFASLGQCPENSAASGTSCACNSGFEEKNGQCVKLDSCAALASWCNANKGVRKNYAVWDHQPDTFCYTPPDDHYWDTPKFPGCNQGCLANAGPSIGLPEPDFGGRIAWRGDGALTGGKCSNDATPDPNHPEIPPAPPSTNDPKVNDPACAGSKGEVNGQTVCIPASSATGVDWTGATSNSDGTKTEGKTTTTCSNGICESTTTKTTKDAAGNVTGTTTTTDKVSQHDYCAKNPGSMVCAAVNANPMPGKDNTNGGNGNGTGSGGCNISNCSDTGGGGPGKVGFPGTGAGGEIGQLYQPKYPDGPVKLWNDKSAALKSSGLGSLALKLFPQVPGGGTPPQWVVDFDFGPLGSLGVHDISPPQWLWDVLKAIVILTSLITARRLIFGG